MQQATLLFLLKDNQVLLAMKKRGFGAGHWNGVGGKPDPGETIEQTAIRECQEEINVTPVKTKQVAELTFLFDGDKAGWNQVVTVYTCKNWSGEPTETEEMAPKWFNIADIPYDSMWEDDRYWLPEVLAEKFVKATFRFDAAGKLTEHELKTS